MSMLCHGIDLVEVPRVARLCQRHGSRFANRCFTGGERRYCVGKKREAEHLAVRFAAKEAVLKALGTGLAGGIHWTDIEVRRDAQGCPSLLLTGRAGEIALRLGVERWLISLSHTESMAIASVIGLGKQH